MKSLHPTLRDQRHTQATVKYLASERLNVGVGADCVGYLKCATPHRQAAVFLEAATAGRAESHNVGRIW